MGLLSFTCLKCGSRDAALAESRNGMRRVICARCQEPMGMSFIWRCPACNYRYYHWAYGDKPGVCYLMCGRCGRGYGDRDNIRGWIGFVIWGIVIFGGAGLVEQHGIRRLVAAPDLLRVLATGGLYAVACVAAYFASLRKMAVCPDFLADRASVSHEGEAHKRPWDRLVQVTSLEEEYRFIQFTPFPCACGTRTTRKVGSHGVRLRPMWLWKLMVTRWLPVYRIEDEIEVTCPQCGGRHRYRFDISRIAHIRSGFRRRFIQSPESVVTNHMELVANMRKGYEQEGLRGLEF